MTNRKDGQSLERVQSKVRSDSRFDYSGLSSQATAFLKAQAHRIRRQAATSIILVGKDLIAAKHYLTHGTFLHWVEAEVGIRARTAQVYMQVAQWAPHKSASVALLPPSVLYFLSAPSTPASYINDILRRVESGERIALRAIREELKHLHESRREGNPDHGHTAEDAVPLDHGGLAITVDMEPTASLQHAVEILGRELCEEDFVLVREIFTSRAVLDSPGLAKNIAAAFSAWSGNEDDLCDPRQELSIAAETQIRA
jgi:hypothetical protein